MKKNPNGYGGITKLSGNRRKPYLAYKSEMVREGRIALPSDKNSLEEEIAALLGASDIASLGAAYLSARRQIDQASGSTLTLEDYKDMLEKDLREHLKKCSFKVKQKKIPLGTFATKKEAQIALAKYNETRFDIASRKITFKEAFDRARPSLNLNNKNPATVSQWENSLKKCSELFDMPLCDIKTVHLQTVLDSYKEMSSRTISAIKAVMTTVFAYGIQNDIISRDYTQYLKINSTAHKTKKKALTKSDVQMLWKNKGWTYSSPTHSVFEGFHLVHLLLVLIYSGMRIDELLQMKCCKVHPKEGYFECKGTKTAAADRIIPIHPKIADIVAQHFTDPDAYLFGDKNGDLIKYSNLNNTAFAVFKDTMNFPYTFHECRHTFATYSLLNLDKQARSFILGHADGITDEVYTHPELIIDRLKNEMANFKII